MGVLTQRLARRVAACVLLCAVALPVAQAFYLPGVGPRAFTDGEEVNMKVQTLVSTETPLVFDYYQLPFCAPEKIQDLPENLGEALAGDKAHTSAFKAKMKVNEYCKTLCKRKYTAQEMEEFQDFAILDYRVNMRLDSLPLAEMNTFTYEDKPTEKVLIYDLGYPLGGHLEVSSAAADAPKGADQYVLNNHLRFKILYHPFDSSDDDKFDRRDTDGNYIVGFQVVPFSIEHKYNVWDEAAMPNVKLTTCTQPPSGQFETHNPMIINHKEATEVIWTYDVEWERSTVKWGTRWDVYLQLTDDKIHWFSIINSLVIVMFLSGIIGLIMVRILRKDFARYNDSSLSEEEREEQNRELREETGWKLVYGDVFRPPPMATLLSVYAGTGCQVLIMSVLTLVFACLGFLSPANRGALLSSVLFFYVLMGVPAGYVSARFCKLVREPNHFKATLLTATLFPGVCFVIFFSVNMVAWAKQSSSAVPFGTLIVLMFLWFGISLPLIFFGSYLGFRREVMSTPAAVSAIPRQIPPTPWWMSPACSAMVGGLLPFGAVFVEMFFILSSIWQHRFYYMFGFLGLVVGILIITVVEITIVLAYLHLCAEDYRWWWRSFMTAGSVAFYAFMYGTYHYWARSNPAMAFDALAASIYFGYMGIISYAIFVLCGFCGFVATFAFTRKIYGSIKID